MPRNTPWEAVDRYLTPFRAALGCIVHGTRVTTAERSYAPDRVHSLVINGGDLLELRQHPTIALSGGQRFRVVEDAGIEEGPHRVHTVEYFYAFSTADEQEILHIDRGLLGATRRSSRLTSIKKHVPTGRVSFESIIRFAIEELGVEPLREDWPDILEHGRAQFDQYRRPPSF